MTVLTLVQTLLAYATAHPEGLAVGADMPVAIRDGQGRDTEVLVVTREDARDFTYTTGSGGPTRPTLMRATAPRYVVLHRSEAELITRTVVR